MITFFNIYQMLSGNICSETDWRIRRWIQAPFLPLFVWSWAKLNKHPECQLSQLLVKMWKVVFGKCSWESAIFILIIRTSKSHINILILKICLQSLHKKNFFFSFEFFRYSSTGRLAEVNRRTKMEKLLVAHTLHIQLMQSSFIQCSLSFLRIPLSSVHPACLRRASSLFI